MHERWIFRHGSTARISVIRSSCIHPIRRWRSQCVCRRSPSVTCKLNFAFGFCRAEALFNAVKKQYGLHSYLLSIALPTSPLPAPVNVPLPIPRLPPISSMNYSPVPPVQVPNTLQASASPSPSPSPSSLPPPLVNGTQDHPRPAPSPGPLLAPGNLHLSEGDIQQVGRFVREFAVMSLLPWMEKCVIDWNEVVRNRFYHMAVLPSKKIWH